MIFVCVSFLCFWELVHPLPRKLAINTRGTSHPLLFYHFLLLVGAWGHDRQKIKFAYHNELYEKKFLFIPIGTFFIISSWKLWRHINIVKSSSWLYK